MLTSILGIISPRGLMQLWPESPAALRMMRGKMGEQWRAGIWAVLPQEMCDEVTALMSEGEESAALRMLNTQAREIGILAL